ncbi:MAG: sulfurtransferase [Methanothrix sp.]|nr:sulfurtransferase [Methanothrix sp.]
MGSELSLIKSKLIPIIVAGVALLAVVLLSMQSAYAGGECASLGGACDDGGWSGADKLDEIGDPTAGQVQTSTNWPAKSREVRWNMSASTDSNASTEDETDDNTANSKTTSSDSQNENITDNAAKKAAQEPITISRSDEARVIMAPLEDVTDADILLDVSENSSTHISGSVVLPYMEFDETAGTLKPVSEISRILGDAGISRDDSVVIYGQCLPCGGGPSVATYIYWMMKGLGHEKVKLLDGTAEDWEASGQTTTSESNVLPAKVYTPAETDDFNATYDLVESGQVQIVDARTLQEYGQSTIPGSISIPYASVLYGDRIKDESQLKKVFMLLDKDKPVVVYTNTGMKASVVWFALEMMRYDARLYSYQDWMAHKSPQGNASSQ